MNNGGHPDDNKPFGKHHVRNQKRKAKKRAARQGLSENQASETRVEEASPEPATQRQRPNPPYEQPVPTAQPATPPVERSDTASVNSVTAARPLVSIENLPEARVVLNKLPAKLTATLNFLRDSDDDNRTKAETIKTVASKTTPPNDTNLLVHRVRDILSKIIGHPSGSNKNLPVLVPRDRKPIENLSVITPDTPTVPSPLLTPTVTAVSNTDNSQETCFIENFEEENITINDLNNEDCSDDDIIEVTVIRAPLDASRVHYLPEAVTEVQTDAPRSYVRRDRLSTDNESIEEITLD